jgi:hypothetical protein
VVFLIPVREEVYSDLIAPKLGEDQMGDLQWSTGNDARSV